MQTLIAVILLSAAAAIFLFFELKRPRRFKAWRVMAVIIMVAAVAGLIFRPALSTQQSKGVIVLTPQYNAGQADSLLQVHPGLEILVAAGADPYPGGLPITSVHDLADVRNQIAFVIGTGLSIEALDVLDTATFQFIPSPYPEGIIQLHLPKTIYPNRANFIEGVIRNTTEKKLVLSGPGGKVDSVHIDTNGLHPFHLAFTPKTSGRFIYELSMGDRKEEIPVSVTEEIPLDVLIIADYPTFENRQLKNFLSRKHRLLIRYRVSRSKFRYEHINRQVQPITRLTKSNLTSFDLLIIDSDALKKLAEKEKEDVRESVSDGLGLIVMFNEDPVTSKMLEGFAPVEFMRYSADTARVTLNGSSQSLPAWAAGPKSTPALRSLLRNRDRVLSAYVSSGFGKVGFQLLQETYRLVLQGDSVEYSALWSPLIGEIARRELSSFQISCRTAFPRFPDAAVTIEIISGGAIPDLYYDGDRIPPAEDIWIDDIWTAKLWVGDHGWHSVSSADSTRFYFYVSPDGSWPDLSASHAIEENLLRGQKDPKILTSKTVHLPVSRWIFYLAFLLSAGFLWLSPKL